MFLVPKRTKSVTELFLSPSMNMKTTKIDVCKQIISTWGNLPIAKSPKHWIVLLAIACILYSSMQSLTGCKKVQPAKLLGIKLTKEFLVWKMTKVCKYSGPVSENGVIVYSLSPTWKVFGTKNCSQPVNCWMELFGVKSITFRRNTLLATSFVVPVLKKATKMAL